jgi:serine/threonine-protein kinase
MPKLTAESFFNLIQQSGLIEHRRLQPLIEKMQRAEVDMTDSAAVSAWLVEHGPLTQWQTNKLLQGKHKGFTLGKYKLMELLGKGGMSSVYLAEHQLMRRRCAIKVLPMKRVNDSSYLERFHREARAVASLDHPNVVRAYDIDHELDGDREIHFLVMEYVKGQSIQDMVTDHGVLSIENAAEYFRQAALGLESAHKSGLVHRDVKPGNLLVDLGGVVKVLDLGLARFNESTDESGAPLTVTHDEKVLGTADYLAPEQALDSHSVDHRADIYGLGCTMYFALTGHPPFREGTLTQRLMWHQVKEPPEISESRAEVDQTDAGRALVGIIKKLMAKPVDDRHQSMKEVADALLQWLKQYAGADWHARNRPDDSGMRAGQTDASVAARAAVPPVAQAVSVALPVDVPAAVPVTPGFTPAPTAPIAPPATPVVPVASAAAPAPAAAQSGDAGFNAFLSQLGGNATQAAPAAPPIVAPAAAAPVTPASPVVPTAPAPAPVAAPVTPVPVALATPVVADAVPEIPVATPLVVPDAAPVVAEPVVPGETPVEPDVPEAAVISVVAAVPAEAEPAIPVAAPVSAEPVPAEPVLAVAAASTDAVGVPVAEPIAVESEPPAAVPQFAPAEPAVATGGWSPNAPTGDAVPVVAPFAPDETVPTAELLAADEDPEPAYAGNASTPDEITAPVADQPPGGFDPGLIPDPVADDDEFPSLLGGTPTAAVAGTTDGQATATSLAPTQTFIPADHSAGGDATVITPVDDSSLPAAAAPIITPVTDAAVVAAAVAESSPPPVAPLQPAAPVFPGPTPAEPVFAAPVEPAPAVAAPVAPNAAPPFPGPEATPAFPPAPAAPAFPGAPAPPAFPGAPAASVAQPAAVPGSTPARAAKKPLPIPMIVGIVIAALAVGGGIYMAIFGGGDDPGNSTKTTDGGTKDDGGGTETGPATSSSNYIGFIINVGPEGDFQTLQQLFDNLKRNKDSYDRAGRRQKINVTVVGGTTFDGINIDNSKEDYPKGIHLVADGVTRPILKGSGNGPVVSLVAVEDFRLQGFEIDASGKDVAIKVAGMVPGTTFHDLQISGYRKIGIHGQGARGLNGDELIIEKIDLRPGDGASVGIRLNGEGDNESVRTFVRNCRMFGPQEAGVVIDGGCNYVELREIVIDQAAVGVHLTGGPMRWRDLMIANVTFYECSRAGIAFSDMPAPGGGLSGTSMAFCRNLFAKCSGPELLIEKGFTTGDHDKQFDNSLTKSGGAIEQNWSDRQEPARVESGERELIHREPFEGTRRQRVPSFSFVSTDRNSADFLATKNGTPYANIGGPKLGTKKYIGAVAPKQ